MVKFYSDVLNKWFDSEVSAIEAEKKFEENKKKEQQQCECINKKIDIIKKQRDAELKECTDKLNAVTQEIDAIINKRDSLIKERDSIRADIQHINDEASTQIDELLSKKDIPNDECHVSIKTFDSTKDKEWKTIIDETGKTCDIEKKLRNLKNERSESNELRRLLQSFNMLNR